jgi:hypothetical protein
MYSGRGAKSMLIIDGSKSGEGDRDSIVKLGGYVFFFFWLAGDFVQIKQNKKYW